MSSLPVVHTKIRMLNLVLSQKTLTLWFRRLFFSQSLCIRCFYCFFLAAVSPQTPLHPSPTVGLQTGWWYRTLNTTRVQSRNAQPHCKPPLPWAVISPLGWDYHIWATSQFMLGTACSARLHLNILKVYLQLLMIYLILKSVRYLGLCCSSVECHIYRIKPEMGWYVRGNSPTAGSRISVWVCLDDAGEPLVVKSDTAQHRIIESQPSLDWKGP